MHTCASLCKVCACSAAEHPPVRTANISSVIFKKTRGTAEISTHTQVCFCLSTSGVGTLSEPTSQRKLPGCLSPITSPHNGQVSLPCDSRTTLANHCTGPASGRSGICALTCCCWWWPSLWCSSSQGSLLLCSRLPPDPLLLMGG